MAQIYAITENQTHSESQYAIQPSELRKMMSELQKGDVALAGKASKHDRSNASRILNRDYDPYISRHRELVCEVYRILKKRAEKYPVIFPNIPWLEAWYARQVAKTPNAAQPAAGGE